MALTRRLLMLAPIAALSSCAATKSVPDGSQVSAGQGLLAMRLSSNALGFVGFNPFGESTYGARVAENLVGAQGSLQFIDGERYFVLPVGAGEYMWTKVTIGNHYAWLRPTRFRVLAGSITYIGHVRLFVTGSKYSFTVADREADMREYLRQNFPVYDGSMPFTKALAQLGIGA